MLPLTHHNLDATYRNELFVVTERNGNYLYCYFGYQVFLINSFYSALLVMITFIQVNTSSYRA